MPIYSIHSFKLKVGQVIPANGSIQLKFIKNWTALGITQGLRKSLDISLDVVNKSQTNIDTDLSDNKLYISVSTIMYAKTDFLGDLKIDCYCIELYNFYCADFIAHVKILTDSYN